MKKNMPCVLAVLLPCLLGSCANQDPATMQGGARRSIVGTELQNKFMEDQKKTVGEPIVGPCFGSIREAGHPKRLGPLGQLAVMHIGTAIACGLPGPLEVSMKKALSRPTEANFEACINASIKENGKLQVKNNDLRQKLAAIRTGLSKARARDDTRALAGYKKDLQALDTSYAGEIKALNPGMQLQEQVLAKAGVGNSRYAQLNSSLAELKQSGTQLKSYRGEATSLMNSL